MFDTSTASFSCMVISVGLHTAAAAVEPSGLVCCCTAIYRTIIECVRAAAQTGQADAMNQMVNIHRWQPTRYTKCWNLSGACAAHVSCKRTALSSCSQPHHRILLLHNANTRKNTPASLPAGKLLKHPHVCNTRVPRTIQQIWQRSRVTRSQYLPFIRRKWLNQQLKTASCAKTTVATQHAPTP
jgi:hypothetical protein